MGFKADKRILEKTIDYILKSLEVYDRHYPGQITHQTELNQAALDLQTILKIHYTS